MSSLLAGFGHEAPFVETTTPHANADSAQFALRSRVLLLNSPSGIGTDIALGAILRATASSRPAWRSAVTERRECLIRPESRVESPRRRAASSLALGSKQLNSVAKFTNGVMCRLI